MVCFTQVGSFRSQITNTSAQTSEMFGGFMLLDNVHSAKRWENSKASLLLKPETQDTLFPPLLSFFSQVFVFYFLHSGKEPVSGNPVSKLQVLPWDHPAFLLSQPLQNLQKPCLLRLQLESNSRTLQGTDSKTLDPAEEIQSLETEIAGLGWNIPFATTNTQGRYFNPSVINLLWRL